MTQGQTGGAMRRRLTGPGAAALKYDLITALLVTAAQGDPVQARLALRLSLLVTARYNWQSGTFAVGLREMASMWGVTERTAKRELSALRQLKWIDLHRPAARGRVAEYRIDLDRTLHSTMPYWEAVGPDYTARMSGTQGPDVAAPGNVIPLHRAEASQPLPEADDRPGAACWARVARQLSAENSSLYSAWFAPLRVQEQDRGILFLAAPSRFHASYVDTHLRSRLIAACSAADRTIRDVRIVVQ